MRIGATFEPTGAAWYRGVYPLEAMARRGHEIVWPENDTGHPRVDQLASCDVVLVYRRHEEALRRIMSSLASRGIGVVWDNDDDFTSVPKVSPTYKEVGGLRGQKRFSETIRMARLAHVVTVTTDVLRDRYASAGIAGIEVIDNQLPAKPRRRPRKHEGIVIGWVAGGEHRVDAEQLDLRRALEALLAAHADVSVHCVGLDLRLSQRYTHTPSVHFERLPDVLAGFDIGLAPLVDIPFNNARSSIKVKEYAASRVPWLASPRAPYRGLGPQEGGRLVEDDGWFGALDELVQDRRGRKRLAKAGRAWAKTQTVERTADRWEAVFETAAQTAATRRAS